MDSFRSASTRWFVAGYAGVAGFLLLEALVRQRGSASDLDTSAGDDGTTRQVAAAFAAASLGAPLLRRLPVRPLPALCAPMGLVLLLLGLLLRVWSMQTLSDAYSRTLKVTERQITVDRGPYKHVRHPGYLGSLLVWAGFALDLGEPDRLRVGGRAPGSYLCAPHDVRGATPRASARGLRRVPGAHEEAHPRTLVERPSTRIALREGRGASEPGLTGNLVLVIVDLCPSTCWPLRPRCSTTGPKSSWQMTHLLFPEARRRRRRRVLAALLAGATLAVGLTVFAIGGSGRFFGGTPLTSAGRGPSSGPVAHELSPAGHGAELRWSRRLWPEVSTRAASRDEGVRVAPPLLQSEESAARAVPRHLPVARVRW